MGTATQKATRQVIENTQAIEALADSLIAGEAFRKVVRDTIAETRLPAVARAYGAIRALADNADLDDAFVGRKVREIMAEAER